MDVLYEKIVKEDLNMGVGTVSVTNPAGGAALTGTKLNTTTWLGGVFNVKDYGATGDGVTDDSNAIDSARAAISGAGTLFFPKGSYYTEHTLSLSDGLRIIGAGSGDTVINYYGGAGTYWLNVAATTAVNHVEIKDMSINVKTPALGAILVGSTSADYDGSYARQFWTFENLLITGYAGCADYVVKLTQVSISNFIKVWIQNSDYGFLFDRGDANKLYTIRTTCSLEGIRWSIRAGTGSIATGACSDYGFGLEIGGLGDNSYGIVIDHQQVFLCNVFYESVGGKVPTAHLYLTGANASDFRQMFGSYNWTAPDEPAHMIVIGAGCFRPLFFGDVLTIASSNGVQVGTPGSADAVAQFVCCSSAMTQAVASTVTYNQAVVFGLSSAGLHCS